MAKIDIKIKNLSFIKKKLAKIKKKIIDLNPVWDDVRNVFFDIENKRFETQNKGRWRPLSPGYAEWKRQHYPGKPIMVLKGNLKKSLTSMSDKTVYIKNKREMTIGTSIEYALAQHFGIKKKGLGGLPSRPLIGITKQDANKFKKIINKYLDTMIGTNR